MEAVLLVAAASLLAAGVLDDDAVEDAVDEELLPLEPEPLLVYERLLEPDRPLVEEVVRFLLVVFLLLLVVEPELLEEPLYFLLPVLEELLDEPLLFFVPVEFDDFVPVVRELLWLLLLFLPVELELLLLPEEE